MIRKSLKIASDLCIYDHNFTIRSAAKFPGDDAAEAVMRASIQQNAPKAFNQEAEAGAGESDSSPPRLFGCSPGPAAAGDFADVDQVADLRCPSSSGLVVGDDCLDDFLRQLPGQHQRFPPAPASVWLAENRAFGVEQRDVF